MDDQKLENLLNLALDATQEEREKSETLALGYDVEEQTWQVIVRYHGDLRQAGEQAAGNRWQIVLLSGGYGIVTLSQRDLALLAALPEVEYIEKPKRLYFSVNQGRRASCMSALQIPSQGLFGQGVLVAVIDSGVDYFHPDFRNEDGSTRILALWDQSAPSQNPPEGFLQGREYLRDEINAALAESSRERGYQIVPEQDLSGHGTEVLGIAAGNGRSSGGQYRGVASESELLIVKLGNPAAGGFPRTTELMQAIEYVVRMAETIGRPVAVNMSFGNVYGSHRGSSLLETYLDMMANRWKSVFAVGTGNEASGGGHVSGVVTSGADTVIEFAVSEAEPSFNIQIWKNYADIYRITVVHPNGQLAGPFGQEIGASRYRLGGTSLLVYYGEPAPYEAQQEIFIDFIPGKQYLDSGIWRIVLTPQKIVNGEFAMWMTDSRARNPDTRFLRPTPDTTMTIPSTALRVIAVGAYDAHLNAYAPFSGRGWPDTDYNVRPDLAAPGVDVMTTAVRGGYLSVTGTSFATPFVTGAAAMLMEWGIVRKNDPFLYGAKVKAYLRRGARPLPGFDVYPNPQVGYGALCVSESLPKR